jgi:hypothetical protein
VNSTDTTSAPAAGGRQVGQLLAGRYRLGIFKGGDDIADVWHALDETTERVVTLEILRDRENDAARQRFLAEAHRMAAIERPSVMRVAAIHNETSDTFIVFEHLIPLPVVLTGLSAVAKDIKPSTKAAEENTIASSPSAPQAPVSPVPSMLSSVVGPKRSASESEESLEDDTTPTIVDLDAPEPIAASRTDPTVRIPDTLQASLNTAKSDVSAVIADVRALLPERFDTSFFSSLIARLQPKGATRASTRGTNGTLDAATRRATALLATAARTAAPVARRVAANAGPLTRRVAANAGPLARRIGESAGPVLARAAANAAPLIDRARHNQIVSAVAVGGIVLALFVVSPLDDAIVGLLRQQNIVPTPTAVPSGGLSRAPFEVPPLGAYGAAFESQGPYPTTTPNGNVEWVVALRNTGSAGWYRGIEGAQAALALPDGTGVAVQSTAYVAPGQVGWFVVHFRARAEVGTYDVKLQPRIDGRGPMPDLGIYAVVTVSTKP